MSFKKNLAQGKKGEKYVHKALTASGIDCEFNDDPDTRLDYDLKGKLGKKKFTIEVKLDFLAAKTGNIALEFYNSSKNEKSGIDGTKATIWAHVVFDDGNPTIWLISVKALRSYIKKNKPWKVISGAGDGNAELYLYEDSILEEIFSRIDNVNDEAKKKIIKGLLN